MNRARAREPLKLPLLGLGTFHSGTTSPDNLAISDTLAVGQAVVTAITHGYRLIDTAYTYRNERQVGEAVAEAIDSKTVTRDELFVVSKLPMIGMQAQKVERFLRKSLKDLGLSHVDLYLIHAPVGCIERSEDDLLPMQHGKLLIDRSTDHIAIWREMEHMVDLGLATNIGLSNFSIQQLSRIIANARISPAVHQVELNVYFQQKEMRQFCRNHSITLMAYGPLGSLGRKAMAKQLGIIATLPDPLNDDVVKLIAKKHKCSSAQILLRFLVQQDIVVIPKSVNDERIRENADIFSFQLDNDDMKALESLDRGEAGRTFRFGKDIPGYQEHPEAWM